MMSSASTSGSSRPRPRSAGLPTRRRPSTAAADPVDIPSAAEVSVPRRRPRTPTGCGRPASVIRNGSLWTCAVADLRRVLIDAVCAGNEQRVAACVEATSAGVSCAVDERGWPILCVAVERGTNPAILRLLLKHGARVDGRIPVTHQTALHLAARLGYQVFITYLVTAGADVNAVDFIGFTPLVHACRHGNSSAARLLLRLGAKSCGCAELAGKCSSDRRSSNGAYSMAPAGIVKRYYDTALHAAAAAGHVDCVRVLLEESDCRLDALDDDGRTAIVLAATTGRAEVIETFIDYLHNDVTSADRRTWLNLEDPSSGRTVLHFAVRYGWTQLVARLIHVGVDVDRRDRDWKTAFSVAVEHNRRDIIPILVRARCDVNVTDRLFYTALHHAARAGHADLLHVIAAATDSRTAPVDRVDVNLKAQYGITPLMLASHAGHWRAVDELLRLGARPDVVDRHRASPLVYALLTPQSTEPCPAVIKALIRHNANIDELVNVKALCTSIKLPSTVLRGDCLENRLYTPAELAILRGQLTTLAILLRAGCDVSRLRIVSDLRAMTQCYSDDQLTHRSSGSATSGCDGRVILRLIKDVTGATNSNQTGFSLQHLCRRPVLDAALRVARRYRLPLCKVIAQLPVPEDVRRLLNFEELDQNRRKDPPPQVERPSPSTAALRRVGEGGVRTDTVDHSAISASKSSSFGSSSLLRKSTPVQRDARPRPKSAVVPSPRSQPPFRCCDVSMYVPRDIGDAAKNKSLSITESTCHSTSVSSPVGPSSSQDDCNVSRLRICNDDGQVKFIKPAPSKTSTSQDSWPSDRVPTLVTAACEHFARRPLGPVPSSNGGVRPSSRILPTVPSLTSAPTRLACRQTVV